jgi:hypothetical protein
MVLAYSCGRTDGGTVWSTATARLERRAPPRVPNGVPIEPDDGLYCIVTAVLAPTRPDPNGKYSYNFVGGDWRYGLLVGTSSYEHDRSPFGSVYITIMMCRSLLAPPEKDCPEPAPPGT